MHNGIKYFLSFTLGAAAGSVVAWKVLKSRYERMVQDEIDAFKEYWANREGVPVTNPVDGDTESSTDNIIDGKEAAKAIINEYRDKTSLYRGTEENEEGGSDFMDDFGPKVITPEECGDIDEYEIISLTYYADGVLTDDMDEPIENIDETVGYTFDEHFGEYEDDSVYIRNHRLKCDYEILKDERNYSDLGKNTMNLSGDN